jgi:hypothetical protein
VFKRFDVVFAAAVAVGVVVPLAWHAGAQRAHRRMLERVGAEADAKFQARQALERDLVKAQFKNSEAGGDPVALREALLAVYAKHGVEPPPELADGG